MACSPMLFILRARQHFGDADLRRYLGEAKVYPARTADIVAVMVARIRLEREVFVTRDEYAAMCRKEVALAAPDGVGWNSGNLFSRVAERVEVCNE